MRLSVRFVERALAELHLRQQALAIQRSSSLRTLTITDTGVEMLTSLVGRGLSPSLRRIIASTLRERIEGHCDWQDVAGDILTEVYGEIFGPLFTCLELGGDFEVVRLVATNQHPCPDVLLISKDRRQLILQECKAVECDLNRASAKRGTLDTCGSIRHQRNDGRSQLRWPDEISLTSSRIGIRSPRRTGLLPIPGVGESVVVTAVPDGRLRRAGLRIHAPNRTACQVPCTDHCLFSPGPSLVAVLHSRYEEGSSPEIPQGDYEFLMWYKACEQLIRGKCHGSLTNAYCSLLKSWQMLEQPASALKRSFPLIVGLAQSASRQGVYLDLERVREQCAHMPQPSRLLRSRGIQLSRCMLGPPRVSTASPQQLGRAFFAAAEASRRPPVTESNWLLTWGDSGEQRDGADMEAHIRLVTEDTLEMTMVPCHPSGTDGMYQVCQIVAEMVGECGVSSEDAAGKFADESVSWENSETGEVRNHSLGRAMGIPQTTGVEAFVTRDAVAIVRLLLPYKID